MPNFRKTWEPADRAEQYEFEIIYDIEPSDRSVGILSSYASNAYIDAGTVTNPGGETHPLTNEEIDLITGELGDTLHEWADEALDNYEPDDD